MLRHLVAACILALAAASAWTQQDPTVGAPDQLSSPGTTSAAEGGADDLPGTGGMDPDGIHRRQALDQQRDALSDPLNNGLQPPDPQLPGPRTETFELPGGQPPSTLPATGSGSANGLGAGAGDGASGNERGSNPGSSR